MFTRKNNLKMFIFGPQKDNDNIFQHKFNIKKYGIFPFGKLDNPSFLSEAH